MSALTLLEVKGRLGIDFADAVIDQEIISLMSAADAYMKGALGANYPVDDERVKMVMKLLISDLYDNHDLSDKVSGARRRLMDSMLEQVRLEMRGVVL